MACRARSQIVGSSEVELGGVAGVLGMGIGKDGAAGGVGLGML
jgi:hypothetical protein